MNHMLRHQQSEVVEDEASVVDPNLGTITEALNIYQSHENVKNFRVLLRQVLSGGHSIDMKMSNGQTLLHHAVSHDLVKEVIQILNCGAILVENKYEKTPLDIALERGNQIILQILHRSADYQNYVKEKFGDDSLPKVRLISSNKKGEASTTDSIFGQHKYSWSQYELDRKANKLVHSNSHIRSVVYDDYLDWTDGQRTSHQESFLTMLNKAEKSFHKDLGLYSERKKAAIYRLQNMDPSLRDREHRFCMKIWSTVVGERDNRKYLEQISTTSEHLKKALEISYQHVYYSGLGQMRYYNGFVMKLWKQVHVRLTGSTLRLGHENSTLVQDGDSTTDRGSLACCKSSPRAVMDSMNDSISQAKSRTIMLDCIESVEVSLNLPLFPRVQQALGTHRSSTSSNENNSGTNPEQGTKVYFIFHFKSSPPSCNDLSSSPYLKLQRDKSQTPPKHPIVLSLNATSTTESSPRVEGAVAFLNAIHAAMPDVEVTGSSCLMNADTTKHDDRNHEYDHESFSIDHNAGHLRERSQPPLYRNSESQVYSPSDWSHLGSGRTSVESLLTANSSMDSHRTRSSHSSSQRRSTLSSMDESVSDHDQQQIDVMETRKRPCVLGSVMEERESRHSNESHSSHSHSRNNSSNACRLQFSNDVILEHSRYMYHESLSDSPFVEESHPLYGGVHASNITISQKSSGSSLKPLSSQQHSHGSVDDCSSSTGKPSPKRIIEKNGIMSCENNSSVGDEDVVGLSDGGLVDVDWASVDSAKNEDVTQTPNVDTKKYDEFADTISGARVHHPASELLSRNRSLSLEVLAVVTNESVLSPQSQKDEREQSVDKEDTPSNELPVTPNRPSLLALSLQNSPLPPQQHATSSSERVDGLDMKDKDQAHTQTEDLTRSVLSSSLHLQNGQMSFSEPLFDSSSEMQRMLSTEDNPPSPPPSPSSEITGSSTQGAKSIPVSQSQLSQSLFHSKSTSPPSAGHLDGNAIDHSRHSLVDLPGCFSPSPPIEESDEKRRLGPTRSMSMSVDTTHQQSAASCIPPSRHSLLIKPGSTNRVIHSTRHSICDPSNRSQYTESMLDKPRNVKTSPSLVDTAKRPVSKLLRVLSKVRSNRDIVQARLVKCITERETFLEILHYLQSLRTLVKNPPTTPLLHKPNATPDSVLTHIKRINRKAFSLLTLTRQSDEGHESFENLDGSSNPSYTTRDRGYSTLSNAEEEFFYNEETHDQQGMTMSPGHMFDFHLNSSDDEEAERLYSMEDDGNLSSIRDLGRGIVPSVSGRGKSIDSIVADDSIVGLKNSYEAETFVTKMLDSSTSFIVNAQEASVGGSYQSSDGGRFISFDNNEVAEKLSHQSPASMMEKAIKNNAYRSHHSDWKNLNPSDTFSASPALSSSNVSDDIARYFRSETPPDTPGTDPRRESAGRTGSGISSLAQLGAPPVEVLDMHAIIQKDLEEVWQCDRLIYETVERLAHCLVLREQTWSQINAMKNQEKIVEKPDVDDLYDIEF
mmetsp:Transcript_10849/g.17791  ORF Transcript_10849/g.17791 Transcript_10849/m.17791 type:complete len:1494 (+) Transcript_10849:164-4645(+)|eukprot:CAMPEP_0114413886 /NCGR_PEP_ID=MMETSP0103-20121206/1096_1 /TAXON_ID=37642 ORGANISM="Paraphysomonas imperforata, Strain PA2" /NCGR_SAMPLE_ID=MMETSP0103 /ASSEMBLY_ACC=CAM_ASM_000201 /LENGTH=1493 /DNA_ID=CAMNT_0001581995 /DNA_START=85 /DNA_END=4566 /DNA_ORIENTATION=-